MVFSSIIFLFGFLPIFLLFYRAFPARGRNLLLLLFSLIFYAWGETWLVLVMLASTGIDYLCGRVLVASTDSAGERSSLHLAPGGHRNLTQRIALAVSIGSNLTILIVFKYFNFGLDSWNRLAELVGLDGARWNYGWEVILPLGISFYTFQSMSYTIDVYRGRCAATRKPIDFACFVTMFPQLVAGPIVRYTTIAQDLATRQLTLAGFATGVRRFILGMGKKVLIANTVAVPADRIFALSPAELTPAVAWLGLVCYTLQIYFDFSGYSDMAIGLGQMIGFRFPENFRYPYTASSVREFWRRWHISLSTWFRDYLYVPLGGSRCGTLRTYSNLFVVFLLCGLWHGADWTFVIWGLSHGLFLVVERTGPGARMERLPRTLRHVYTLAVVMGGWVLFRAESLAHAGSFYRALAGFPAAELPARLDGYLDLLVLVAIVAGVIGSMPLLPRLAALGGDLPANALAARRWAQATADSLLLVLLLACAMSLAGGSHNPFIYFRF